MPKMYFGHPINVYGTDLERQLLRIIAGFFPEWEIENPGLECHKEGYKRYMEMCSRGMDYFFQEVLPNCQAGIFLPFLDGKFGIGVFGEAKFIAERGYPIFQITPGGIIYRINLKEMKALSIEETRSRIRFPSGEIRPYYSY